MDPFSTSFLAKFLSASAVLSLSLLVSPMLGCGAGTNASSDPAPPSQALAADQAPEAQADPRVEVYVTDWCPYCQRLEAFLKENDVAYIRKNVEEDAQASREHRAMGERGIPVTRIDGETIVRGFQPDRIASLLDLPAN